MTHQKIQKFFLIVMLFMITNTVYAGYEQRQDNQNARIDQGVQSGELTDREARNLERGQNRIERKEDRFENTKAEAMADGQIDRSEKRQMARQRASVQRTQNRQSREIYRKKHNLRK